MDDSHDSHTPRTRLSKPIASMAHFHSLHACCAFPSMSERSLDDVPDLRAVTAVSLELDVFDGHIRSAKELRRAFRDSKSMALMNPLRGPPKEAHKYGLALRHEQIARCTHDRCISSCTKIVNGEACTGYFGVVRGIVARCQSSSLRSLHDAKPSDIVALTFESNEP